MSIIKKRLVGILLLVMVAVVLVGCGSHDPSLSGDALAQALTGKTWTLEKLANRDMENDPPLTMQFMADGTVSGFSGCNTFNGQYTLDGNTLKFGPLASTRKMCGAAANEKEYAFTTMLAKVAQVSLEEDELILFTDNQVEIYLTSEESGGLW